MSYDSEEKCNFWHSWGNVWLQSSQWIIIIIEDLFLTMVSNRGRIMAGMNPSNRIPIRASNDGPVWHMNKDTEISKKPAYLMIQQLMCWTATGHNSTYVPKLNDETVWPVASETWTHPDTCEFSPCPHKERRQAWYDQYTGEASLYHSGVIPENGSVGTIIKPSSPAQRTRDWTQAATASCAATAYSSHILYQPWHVILYMQNVTPNSIQKSYPLVLFGFSLII